MSTKVASIYAELSAKDSLTPALRNAKAGLGDFTSGLNSSLKGLLGLTSAAAIAGLALGVAIKVFREGTAAAAEAETANVKLNQSLLSSGRGAEISAAQIDIFATSLMKLTGFDDEAIKDAYSAIAGFQNLPTDKMDDIVTSAANMSAAFGGDLASNATMIAGVLETGLIPRTWRFDAALKEQIQSMIKAGDTGGALAKMLDELNRKYGGQAVAQMNTYTGSVKGLKTAMGEFWEAVGKGLIGPGKDFNVWLTKNIDLLTQSVDKENDVAWAVEGAYKALGIESTILTHNTFYWAVYGDRLKEVVQWLLKGQAATEYWSAWLAGQPTIIEAASAALVDYANQLNSISDLGQYFTTGLRDMTSAQEALRDAQLAWADALGTGENLDATRNKLEEARTAVEELQTAQDLQTASWVLNILTQELSVDGITSAEMDFLLDYQENTGLLSAEGRKRAEDAWNTARSIKNAYASIGTQYIDVVTRFSAIGQPYGAEPGGGAQVIYQTEGETIEGGKKASGGDFAGWAMVGDAPGGQTTPYTEYVYAPHGARVYTKQQMGQAAPGLGPQGHWKGIYSEPDVFSGAPRVISPTVLGNVTRVWHDVEKQSAIEEVLENVPRPWLPDYIDEYRASSSPSAIAEVVAASVQQAVVAVVQQTVTATVQQAVAASTQQSQAATTASIAPVSKAAIMIAASGERTTMATQQGTQQSNLGNAAILEQLRLIERSLSTLDRKIATRVSTELVARLAPFL